MQAPRDLKRYILMCSLCILILYCLAVIPKTENFVSITAPWSKLTEMYQNEFCIGFDFLKATKDFREDGLEPISLALHSSADIALFIDFHSQNVLDYVAGLHFCDKKFQEKVTLHFVTRLSALDASCPAHPIPLSSLPCDEFFKNRKKLRALVKGSFQLYPINVMRNIARLGAKSDIHFIVDADMVMSEGFAERVKPLANEMIDGRHENVLVVRRFESLAKNIPRNETVLQAAVSNKTVFEFHHAHFFVGHKIADLPLWFNKSAPHLPVTSWPIPYTSSAWEVQVILHANDVYNADYTPPRIRDMQTLVYTLCRANYTFHLLSHVFNVHEGVKKGDTTYSKVVADYGKRFYADGAFKKFRKEMDASYPGTAKRCGRFEAG